MTVFPSPLQNVQALLDIPLVARLAMLFALAACVASLLNAGIYAWSWERRLISPWQATPKGVPRRGWLDCLPILGWLRLRRDEETLGRGFWVRPMLVELGFACMIAALYWWEVDRLGLIAPQLAAVPGPVPGIDPQSIAGALHATFFSHAVLAALMTIATFIDFDERIIPDEVTFTGVIAGLLIAASLPMALLPVVNDRLAAPAAGKVLLDANGAAIVHPVTGGRLYLEPCHAVAPNTWPVALAGAPNRGVLVLGLGCLFFWCFALTDRHWPGRRAPMRQFGRKLRLVAARVGRDLTSSPLREALVAGALLTAMVWFGGGGHWLGLFSALVGLVGGGLIVWAVRIIGSAALRREAMGFGDVTLMMMIGAFVGWQACPLIFFLAPLAGLVLAVLNLVLHGDRAIPFGPFLCLATLFVIVLWGPIWSWGQPFFKIVWLVPAVLVVCFALLGVLLFLLQMLKALLGVAGEDCE